MTIKNLGGPSFDTVTKLKQGAPTAKGLKKRIEQLKQKPPSTHTQREIARLSEQLKQIESPPSDVRKHPQEKPPTDMFDLFPKNHGKGIDIKSLWGDKFKSLWGDK